MPQPRTRPASAWDRLAAAQDVALRDGRLVLARASSTRDGRPRPLLQYCPRCLAEDDPPRFYRSWRFMHEVACPGHRCRLLDRCWRCGGEGARLDPLAQRTASPHSICAACEAVLAGAPVQKAPEAVLRSQRSLACLLYHLAVNVAPEVQRVHLDHLARRLVLADRSVAARECVLMDLPPRLWWEWFGQSPDGDPVQNMALDRAAMGWDHDRLFGRRPRRPERP